MKSKKLVVGFTVLTFSALVLGACSPDNKDDSASSSSKTEQTTASSTTASTTAANADVKIADGKTANAEVPGAGTIVMRQLYTAPHGDKSFAVVNVTLDGDKILSARMDEFQYVEKGDDWTGVPNADAKLGENFPEGNILVAKEENSKAYSAMMKDHGGATQTWDESMTAITNFVKGKTIAEVEKAVKDLDAQGEDAKVSDVVSGATFSDTKGYLQSIVDAAKSGMVSVGEKTSNTDLKEAIILAAPHGDQSFATVTVALDGDKVAATFVDEFQYVDPADFGGVPNSNAAFGEGIKDNLVLGSKYANNEAYSALMKDHAKATQTWEENIHAVDAFAKGKTVAELETAVKDLKGQGEDAKVSDVVSGATFADTAGYLQAIIDAAKKAAE
ncbi:peptidoglycan-binding protein [Enterococcus dispar]|uniref:Peptidoglycan-binding protein n=1 Tax=Enterococcus dispar ATCC 51266 TaxID=1139219 RepID=S1NBK4_9ENTE|nr:hypothetical protein [Enterococcus dispar]EOT39203.1 hypothetical protein OMK_02199 [Enterococcus dispar ATCC 51266]EOW86382.1 hypothetical protein I569_01705 [Enterococcus dispar ATCC 51266]OJG38246.1 hypothetical protein RV01_GL000382 [Enterococcus dispar]